MMKMYLYDFLKMFDGALPAAVYINDEDDPIYTGPLFDTPWFLVDLELNYEEGEPISYRDDFGAEYGNKPGLVIFLKEG